ncbi:very-long-chain (3R)-3-hydroxyacyl-CoA dehydratase 4 isoform X2 [Pseudoliparis swirei]|uniref:very-long-chain (3R)-3-hydroxyacyl-CoA dehydratase 4 isoform X2 n=1 Tax=Pseudoliparis swirei TaxID=2059687 RepID=UPI0024BE47C3|nr:very-long-chain (3R)-3-hydroxyacyl-CoA dehydratase 4 isoform X2 [Pseudoliparis swirei]XP_056298145.1 very-long-chain (3R)-3-hydroxyacyl-CoA dehydratase 4 isoform X2 [Pseudoliparis swirei]
MLSFRLAYIFSYNLFQFCGHTWILANTIARFLMFGQDALADTFYSVGFMMSLCQLLSILELFHIADGIEKARLLPRFIQVCIRLGSESCGCYVEADVCVFNGSTCRRVCSSGSGEEPPAHHGHHAGGDTEQTRGVCPALLVERSGPRTLCGDRYPHELLCAMDSPSPPMLWTRYTLCIPLYILSVATEGLTLYQALACEEPPAGDSCSLNTTGSTGSTGIAHPPLALMISLPILALGPVKNKPMNS